MDWINNCFAEAPQLVTAFFHRVTTSASNLWDGQIKKREQEGPNTRNQTDVNLPNNQDVVINVTQTDATVSATTSLLSQAPLNGQTTGGSDIENPRSLSPADQDVVINVNDAVRDQTDVGVSHTTPISAQATSSFNIESSSRSLSSFEVVSNGNAHEVRDQTVVDMSDTASLLPQTSTAAQATSSSQIQNSRNPPQEGGQNLSGVANVGSGVTSQSGQPPRLIAGRGIDLQALIIEAKEVANRVTIISAGGIFSELSGVIGNEDAVLMHTYFFKAFMILCYISLASGLGLHRLIKMSPETRGFVMIVKFTINFSQGSLIYAVSCAICLLFPSKVGVVVILIVPLVPIALVAILGRARKDQRPSV